MGVDRKIIPTPWLATGFVVAGAAGVLYGTATHPAPFDSLPGLHGAMVMGYLAFLLGMLGRLGYRQTLTVVAPVLAIQAVMGVAHHAAWSALVGVEVLIFGGVGLALSALASAPALAARRSGRRGRARAPQLSPSS